MDPLQGDRLLIAAFVSVLVGFITAVLSIVRLVNDKESKTTDYRQGWTDSLRKCVADLISNINSLAGAIVRRAATNDRISTLRGTLPDGQQFDEKDKVLHDHLIKTLADDDAHIRELRRSMFQSYAFTRLHFKPNDATFTPLENKFDVVADALQKLEALSGDGNVAERLVLRERVHADVAEITGYARFILKTTWETVKRGERAYELTKRWSLIGGAIALAVLLVFAGVAGLNAWKHTDGQAPPPAQFQLKPADGTSRSAEPDPKSSLSSHDQTVTVILPGICGATQSPTRPPQPKRPASGPCGPQ